jgi:hypothetical protein
MSFKKVTKKEWLAMGLPESITYIGPFYEYDRKKKEFKKTYFNGYQGNST